MKLTEQDNKQLEKYRKRVRKQYPGAFLLKVGSGYYTIAQECDDLSIKDILSEYLFQPVPDPLKAWELANLTVRTSQNINRTHPLRIEGMNMEDKIARAERRRLKQEEHIRPKTRKWDNY